MSQLNHIIILTAICLLHINTNKTTVRDRELFKKVLRSYTSKVCIDVHHISENIAILFKNLDINREKIMCNGRVLKV